MSNKKSLRKIKKDLKMRRDIDPSHTLLSRLSLPHEILVSSYSGLDSDFFKAGDVVVSFSSGDMYELAKDMKNGDWRIDYKRAWKWNGKKYVQKYGYGTTFLITPMLQYSKLLLSYYGRLRYATDEEKRRRILR